MSYSKAVTGWRRLAATSILFFAVAAGPAAAAGGSGGSGGTGLGGTTTTADTTTTPTTTIATTTTFTPPTNEVELRPKTSSSLVRAFGSRMLTLGMQGTDVTILQRDLTALSFNVAASGRFNQLTLQRLKAFQRRYGLTVDGVAGPTTITELKRLLNSRLHITETALAAKELASGTAVTATRVEPAAAGGRHRPHRRRRPRHDDDDRLDHDRHAEFARGERDAARRHGEPAAGTPQAIVTMLDAANRIAFDPYIYGGGHASFNAAGYDCSGSVSYVLHAGGLLATPLDSEQFLQYGLPGQGQLDHDLHQRPDPCVHGDRRGVVRHRGADGAERQRPLVADADRRAGLRKVRRPSSRRLVTGRR